MASEHALIGLAAHSLMIGRTPEAKLLAKS